MSAKKIKLLNADNRKARREHGLIRIAGIAMERVSDFTMFSIHVCKDFKGATQHTTVTRSKPFIC